MCRSSLAVIPGGGVGWRYALWHAVVGEGPGMGAKKVKC